MPSHTAALTRRVSALAGALAAVLVLATAAQAAVLAPWGSTLSATPTLDTANGASTWNTFQEPLSLARGDASDEAVATSFDPGCTHTYTPNNQFIHPACTPWMHDGADGTEWNTQVEGAQATAPQGGQVLSVTVKGCAVADPTATSDDSFGSQGQPVPANSVQFEGLTPHSDGSMTVNNVGQDAGGTPFRMPWCDDARHPTGASANTETTFHPVHMCLNQGDIVSFYDLGGYIPGGPAGWYPQGVPFLVIAKNAGSHMNSMMDAGEGAYHPGDRPMVNGQNQNTGWGDEPGEEVLLQVTEGVGADAYGLCPGGAADEPSSMSNAIDCVYSKLLAGRDAGGHPICGQTTTTASSPTPAPVGSTPPVPPAPVTPALTNLKLNPARFYRATGSTITFASNAAGVASFSVVKVTKVRQRVKGTRSRFRVVTKRTTVRTFTYTTRASRAGVGGKLHGLAPGSYLLRVSARANGRTSQTYTLAFTVLK